MNLVRKKTTRRKKKKRTTPVVVVTTAPVVDSPRVYENIETRRQKAVAKKAKRRKKMRMVIRGELSLFDILGLLPDAVKYDVDENPDSQYKTRLIFQCFAKDTRVKDNCMELWLQRMVLKHMNKKTQTEHFLPIGLCSTLALELILTKVRAMEATKNGWKRSGSGVTLGLLARKTGLVRLYAWEAYSEEEFTENVAKEVIDGRRRRKWLIQPKYDFIIAPIFNREAGHWSVLVLYLRCAINIWNESEEGTPQDYIVHYDPIPGTNRALANLVTVLFQQMGYFPMGTEPICTEFFSEPMQSGTWECGYFTIRMVFDLCKRYYASTSHTDVLSDVDITQELIENTRDIVIEGVTKTIFDDGQDPETMIIRDREKLATLCFFNTR